MNKEIALWLSGLYPGDHTNTDILLFIDCLQYIDPIVFNDERIKMFITQEPYVFLLNHLDKVQRDFPNHFYEFLIKLNVPSKFRSRKIPVTVI